MKSSNRDFEELQFLFFHLFSFPFYPWSICLFVFSFSFAYLPSILSEINVCAFPSLLCLYVCSLYLYVLKANRERALMWLKITQFSFACFISKIARILLFWLKSLQKPFWTKLTIFFDKKSSAIIPHDLEHASVQKVLFFLHFFSFKFGLISICYSSSQTKSIHFFDSFFRQHANIVAKLRHLNKRKNFFLSLSFVSKAAKTNVSKKEIDWSETAVSNLKTKQNETENIFCNF